MKHFFSFVTLLLLGCLPLASYAACSGQFDVSYPDRTATGGIRTTHYNFGQNNSSASFCPGTTGSTQLTFSPNDDGTLQISYVVGGVTTVLVPLRSTTSNAVYTYTLPASTAQITYTIATTVACSNAKSSTLTLALAPTLSLNASLLKVCQGNAVTLTATGSTSGSYTWTAPGMTSVTTTGTVVNGVNTTTLSRTPSATTTYTVTTATACGTTTSQQITVTVPTLTASSNLTTVCPTGQVTLTATSSEPGTTFTWSQGGSAVGSGASITVTPGSTGTLTYRVTSNNPSGCTNTSYAEVPVAVVASTVSVNQPESTIDKGQSVTLVASSNLSNATYSWRSGSTNGPIVGSAASFTAAPESGTTYYVTAATGSCSATEAARVNVNGPLPVKLSWFEARATATGTRLSWATAQEINCEYFRVERSADGREFTALGKVAGAGTTAQPRQYQYLDATTRPALRYYRLAQVDVDGNTHYSPVRVVQADEKASFRAQVYPNPLTAASTLQLSTATAGPVTCTLFDGLGRELLHYTLTATAGEQQVALPALPATASGLSYLLVRQGTAQQVLRLQRP
ncbi:hypothetical protein Q5H93_22035 [Hymenobacter sp. ASUV-10]|uniref:Ig-like domain-containing protein n=1 Tax=Hymenobacter aranciens TaxID=3063996 RepID=A0ABT9BKA6_9BACT|nr:hypothetical protein [Hymenobacter sp. ASUV-10]MDO7877437.1 hypothetical protein [Hymenobacter sp. ASUV-10]